MLAPSKFYKQAPGTLGQLIDWLELKSAKKHYEYTDGMNCMCQQFYADLYPSLRVQVTSSHVDLFKKHTMIKAGEFALPAGFDAIANGYHSGPNSWTYGAALERARKIQWERATTNIA